jgi:hypothetical protein
MMYRTRTEQNGTYHPGPRTDRKISAQTKNVLAAILNLIETMHCRVKRLGEGILADFVSVFLKNDAFGLNRGL